MKNVELGIGKGIVRRVGGGGNADGREIVKKRGVSETIPQSAMLTAPFTQGSRFEFFVWREENIKKGGTQKKRQGGAEGYSRLREVVSAVGGKDSSIFCLAVPLFVLCSE